MIGRTEGNPFFLEESIRALVETGVLVGERSAYRLVKASESLQVPATVQAVLGARIDRLPPEEKRLLQRAAVIGTDVPFALLRAIAECPRRSCAALRPPAGGRVPLRNHPLPRTRHTPSSMPSPTKPPTAAPCKSGESPPCRDRRSPRDSLRRPSARARRRLAHHALRGEEWDKALVYGRQAGEKAMARSAQREGVARFEQALSP